MAGSSPEADLEANGRQSKESSRDPVKVKETSKGSRKDSKEREHRHKDSDSRSRSEKDRHRSRNRDQEREEGRYPERDRERNRRSRDRSKERDRRRHEDDSDREKGHRHRNHSRSSSRSRGKSPSGSRERSKRTSGFDMAPPALNGAPGLSLPGQLPGVPQAMAGIMPGFPFTGTQMSALSAMPMQAMTQQAMKHARRVYVGGLPPLANEQMIAVFFSHVMQVIGGNSAPGDAVVNVYINHEKKFAFVEMRTVEEASNAMALDGILFEGMPVRVRRPSDYNPSLAATLGPSQPSPHLNLAAVGLTPGSISALSGADGPDKVFVGGLPYYLNEAQIKELLESFGPLRGFDIVKDRETGNSKGYAFCVYQDPAVTDVACAALNGLKMGDKTLTVRRATAGGQPKPDQENVLLQAQQQIAVQKIVLQAATTAYGFIPGIPTGNGNLDMESASNVLCLTNLVSVNELSDDQEFEDIHQDIEDECSKYGKVVNLVIPRPSSTEEHVPGLRKAFVEYEDKQGSSKARSALNGRKFAGNTVIAVYYPEDKFASGEFDG